MGALPLYNDLALLCRDSHQSLHFTDKADNYSFTENMTSVPVTGVEFFQAGKEFPVLFIKNDKGNFFPVALLSLDQERNQQIGMEGSWQGQYVPAFIRRYPFALSDCGQVCFDRQAPHFIKEKGSRLFDDKGENTEALDSIIQFLIGYDQEYEKTGRYCKVLEEKNMLVPYQASIMLDNAPSLKLEGFYILDEVKFKQLKEKDVVDWFQSEWLFWSYSHLNSLQAFESLAKSCPTREL
ncbi:SapC family protein [Endozoicomonas sp. Mp262]|uniref:SapC family protein n=1 Tax=Endozoicomonas sp. Mp262 TaxID=2919499 RepID=UPI0021DA510A